jgi:Gpi18-like mannosyltransferase
LEALPCMKNLWGRKILGRHSFCRVLPFLLCRMWHGRSQNVTGDGLKRSSGNLVFILLLLFSLIIRLILAASVHGYDGDLDYYRGWAEAAAQDFFLVYGSGNVDYPPLYLYILHYIGKVLLKLNWAPDSIFGIILIKMPAILADILSGILVYMVTARRMSKKTALILSGLYLFNPAILVNSAMWGQTDGIMTLLVVVGLLGLYHDRVMVSAFFFTCACLMKPQGFIFLPVLFLELIRKKSLKKFLLCMATGLFTGFLIILPFSLWRDVWWIVRLFAGDYSKYAYASLHAHNLFSLVGGDMVRDNTMFLFMPYRTWSYLLTLVVLGFFLYLYIKSNTENRIFLAALVLQAGVFMFTGRMHERYLYPAVMLLIMVFIYCRDRRIFGFFALLSLTVFINQFAVLFYVSYKDVMPFVVPAFNITTRIFSLINLVAVVWLFVVSRDVLLRDRVMLGTADDWQ